MVMKILQGNVVSLAVNSHGNHFIQHCVECFPPGFCACIFEELVEYCYEVELIVIVIFNIQVCINRYGCCVIQRCFSVLPSHYRSRFFKEIFQSARLLVNDPFGNYVIQVG